MFGFLILKTKIRKFFSQNFRSRFFFQETGDLEELGFFDPRWQLRRKMLLPQLALFLGRLPWRRGK